MFPPRFQRCICLTRCSYDGEEGIDAGGVFKDWLGNISRELLKPGALFLPCLSASGASVRCLRLNPLPSEFGVADEAQVLRLLGIVLGFCINHNFPLGVSIAPSLCKLLLRRAPELEDLK
jgi:hypothetical protein